MNQGAQAILAAVSDLASRLKAKGYDAPRASLQFDVDKNWQFWLSLATDSGGSPAAVEYFYGNDLDDIISRAEEWVAALTIASSLSLTAAMAPWFECAGASP